MSDIWPWLVMGGGLVALFLYRYLRRPPTNHGVTVAAMKVPDYQFEFDPFGPPESPMQGLFADTQTVAEHDDNGVSAGAKKKKPIPVAPDKKKVLSPSASYPKVTLSSGVGHEWMPVAISLLVLTSALFVILAENSYGDAQQKWAFGVIGTILGYWFKR